MAMFSGASSTSVHGGEINNSQRDQNNVTVVIHAGGSDSNTLRATSAVSNTNTPGLVRGSSHVGALSASDQEENLMPRQSRVSTDSDLGSSYASFGVEQKPAEATVAISSVIYTHHMLLKKHGMPLYVPQPLARHSLAYRREGVSIGDVGVFTQFGAFDRLFNICLPLRHSMNPEVLPEGFETLILTPADVNGPDYGHGSNSYMTSPLIRAQTGTNFRCSEIEGAILTMPQGAYHEDLVNLDKFLTHLKSHLASWYDYANVVQGRKIANGNIHLVIGCDKTSSWGIATYSHRQSKHNVTHLSFKLINEGQHSVYPKYAWDVDGLAEDLKVGPEEVELLDPLELHAIRPLQNQCTFIRSIDTALGADEWKQHQLKVATAAEARASAQPTPKNSTLASVLAAASSLPGRLGSLMGYSYSIGYIDSMAPTQTLAAEHPSSHILEMLLEKCPKAKVIVVNDSDWCSVIRDSDKDWIITAQDLPRRIQEAFDIVEEEDGTVYLQENMTSSQQPNTSSRVSEDEECPLLEDQEPRVLPLLDSFQISPSNAKADSPSPLIQPPQQKKPLMTCLKCSDQKFECIPGGPPSYLCTRCTEQNQECQYQSSDSSSMSVQHTAPEPPDIYPHRQPGPMNRDSHLAILGTPPPKYPTSHAKNLPIGLPAMLSVSHSFGSALTLSINIEPLRKRALLIGINYKNSGWDLNSPQKDAREFRKLLLEQYGYQDGNIVVLTDEDGTPSVYFPTRANILREIMAFMVNSSPGDEYIFWFSGHSAQRKKGKVGRQKDYGDSTATAEVSAQASINNAINYERFATFAGMKPPDSSNLAESATMEGRTVSTRTTTTAAKTITLTEEDAIEPALAKIMARLSPSSPDEYNDYIIPLDAVIPDSCDLVPDKVVLDDVLRQCLVLPLHPEAKLVAIFDCSFSATSLDLKHHRCHGEGTQDSRLHRIYRQFVEEHIKSLVLREFKSKAGVREAIAEITDANQPQPDLERQRSDQFKDPDTSEQKSDTGQPPLTPPPKQTSFNDPHKACPGLSASVDPSSLDRQHVVCVTACEPPQECVENEAGESMTETIISLLRENPLLTLQELMHGVNDNAKKQHKTMKLKYREYEKQVKALSQQIAPEELKVALNEIEYGKTLCKNVQVPQMSSSKSLNLKKTYLFAPPDVHPE